MTHEFRAALAVLPFACLTPPAEAETPPQPPVETIIVIANRIEVPLTGSAIEPTREGRLSTLPDLFRTAPGVLAEPVFGGVDHPRLAIRGSGLQRGTQPAGRGIELRFDGLPMTYGDGSFDFVEWVEPLAYGNVSILRGGRGARAAGAALGGVIDFRSSTAAEGLSLLARGEAGSFGTGRGQVALSGASGPGSASLSASWFQQQGFRDHNAQEAWRANGRAELALADGLVLRSGFLFSDSWLKLPGPQTLAQIAAGDRSAQPGNVRGDWRRRAERLRGTLGLGFTRDDTAVDLDIGLMTTDVDFRRRDIQLEANQDWSARTRIAQSLALPAGRGSLEVDILWQDGARSQKLYLNGGGTMPSFTGAAGLLWADNDFATERLSAVGLFTAPVGGGFAIDVALGHSWHRVEITDNYPIRSARPAAELSRSYGGFIGIAALNFDTGSGFTLFAAASQVIEPPTLDLLFLNMAGTGAGPLLVNGPNPRRPFIVDLDAQRARTVEAGIKGEAGPLRLDITLYRSWLKGEIVSTADFVAQVVSSAGNADQTTRWGVEAMADVRIASPGLQARDQLALSGSWTWTDARFADDLRFGNNRLPILPPHIVGLGLDYSAPDGGFAALFGRWVPEGGYADYANSLKADGHVTLGGRFGWRTARFTAFVEGRNLTNRRYVSSVIAAQNNLQGADAATFAPGEARAVTAGLEMRF